VTRPQPAGTCQRPPGLPGGFFLASRAGGPLAVATAARWTQAADRAKLEGLVEEG
jgi:hypothetical protein